MSTDVPCGFSFLFLIFFFFTSVLHSFEGEPLWPLGVIDATNLERHSFRGVNLDPGSRICLHATQFPALSSFFLGHTWGCFENNHIWSIPNGLYTSNNVINHHIKGIRYVFRRLDYWSPTGLHPSDWLIADVSCLYLLIWHMLECTKSIQLDKLQGDPGLKASGSSFHHWGPQMRKVWTEIVLFVGMEIPDAAYLGGM